MTAAQEWADSGLAHLYEELKEFKRPLGYEDAILFVRAAYGAGYQHALEESEPAIISDVLGFQEELALRVPVS